MRGALSRLLRDAILASSEGKSRAFESNPDRLLNYLGIF
jgi:hypothetical protein